MAGAVVILVAAMVSCDEPSSAPSSRVTSAPTSAPTIKPTPTLPSSDQTLIGFTATDCVGMVSFTPETGDLGTVTVKKK